MKRSIFGVLFFITTATIFSGLFHSAFFALHEKNQNDIGHPSVAITVLLIGLGPTMAAILSWAIFGKQGRTATLFGTWPLGAILAFIAPTVVMAIFGYPNTVQINPHLFWSFDRANCDFIWVGRRNWLARISQ